ncbi:MAG: sensor histidine kinase [Ginsengibacter sp.]
MRKITRRYWLCQILGWGGWSSLNLFFVYFFASDMYLKQPESRRLFFSVLFIEFLWYILATHFLRFVLKKIGWIKFATNKVIILFIVGVTFTGLLSYYGSKSTAVVTGNSLVAYEKKQDLKQAMAKEASLGIANTKYYLADKNNPKDSINYQATQAIKKSTGWYRDNNGAWQYEDQRKGRFWWDIIFNFILIALWLLLYMVWHYLERNRKDELDKLSLEKTVKELELNTIKSHINPHFIFNSLNSIRALVDENPTRARSAITELSNILRSSMQIEKMETVPLHKELDIVKDYLALEHMRFEERLKI